MTWHTDDTALEALLRLRDDDPLDDDAFTRAVMHRVRHDAAGALPPLDGPAALALLQHRQATERRSGRWRWGGAAAGAVLAAGLWWAGGASSGMSPAQAQALLAGLGVMAWGLVAQALREAG